MDTTLASETAVDTAVDATVGSDNWEARIARLLEELSRVQGDLLSLLDEKRQALAKRDQTALASYTSREQELIRRLEVCHEKRSSLLQQAASEGLPADNLASLADALPTTERKTLRREVEEARRRSRLLQHHSLTNWVAVQRTLIHLSQMVEIIATGGKMQPTYSNGQTQSNSPGGVLVDQSA